MTTDALAVAYGLGSAITWGAADFSGGYACRNNKVLTVIFYVHIVGLISLAGLHFLFAEKPPVPAHLAWGGLAGFFGVLGLVALYKGLATGRMGIVAPVSSLVAATLPIIVAFFSEGLPRTSQMVGFTAALVAVWLFSSGQGHIRSLGTELGLSLLAGTGFSLFFICIDHVSSEAILWPLLTARAVSILFIGAILATRGRPPLPPRGHLPYIAIAGIFDVVGNAFFALATQSGRLDVSAILTSMYPAATVMLARWFLKEQVSPRQYLGLLTACSALALIAV